MIIGKFIITTKENYYLTIEKEVNLKQKARKRYDNILINLIYNELERLKNDTWNHNLISSIVNHFHNLID